MGSSLITSDDFKAPAKNDGEYTAQFLMVCKQQTVN